MYSYLQHLAQVFANNIGSDFSKYTFVFPNHRAGLFFRRHLLQATDQVTFTPKIYTINECFASLSDLCVANQLTLLLRLYRIYKQHRADAEPLEEFLYWGKMMLADFSEIDNHRIDNVAALYSLVKDMHDIDMHFASLSEWGFPGGLDGKESACSVGDLGLIPGLGRFPWRRPWQPTPVFLPG